MEIIAQLGTLLGLSFISGINLYATVAVVGICTKYHLVTGLPPEFSALASNAVITVALLLYIFEFLVDKVPWLDTLWDSIHTLIRPLGGAFLALLQVGEASPGMEVIAFMIGASLASVAHVTKAGARLVINTSPEPFSNIIVSLAEDVGAIGLAYLSLAYPKLSFFITLCLLFVIALLLPLTFRTARMLFSGLFFKAKCALQREAAWMVSRSLPFGLDAFLEEQMEPGERLVWGGKAFAVRVPGLKKFSPVHVAITSKNVHLLYRRRLKLQRRSFPVSELQQQKCYHGMLFCKWLLRTTRGDWLLQLFQPLSSTLPQNLQAGSEVEVHDKPY